MNPVFSLSYMLSKESKPGICNMMCLINPSIVVCGLGILELGRNLPRSRQLAGEWEQATRWVGTGSEPQGGKRGCCFAGKCCQTSILRKSQKQ